MITLQHMHHQDGAQGTAKRGFLFRVVSVMALAMMLIAAFGVAHPNVTRAGQAGTINTNNVEIFQHPTNLTEIGSLDAGDRVDIFWGPEFEMYQVRAGDGTVGWVWAEFLDPDGGSSSAAASSSSSSSSAADQANLWSWSDWVQIDADSLKVRSNASSGADVIDTLGAGEWVQVIGDDVDGWSPIDYYGDVGWIATQYISWDGTFQYATFSSSNSTSQASTGGGDTSGNADGEHWIDVNGGTGEVNLMVGNESIATYWASVGYDKSTDGFYSTANGTFYVYAMYEPLAYTAWADVYITNWVGFDPYRSNGFHSYSKDSNGNVLPNGAGKTGGCVALPAGAIAEVYNFSYIGMRVVVHR